MEKKCVILILILILNLNTVVYAGKINGYKLIRQNKWFGSQEYDITYDNIKLVNSFGTFIIKSDNKLILGINENSKKIAYLEPEELSQQVYTGSNSKLRQKKQFKLIKSWQEKGFRINKYQASINFGTYQEIIILFTLPDIKLSKNLGNYICKMTNGNISEFPSKEISYYVKDKKLIKQPYTHFYTTKVEPSQFDDGIFKYPIGYTQVHGISSLIDTN